jgi:protocatechuate 3,4-dioxygenase beta subunit
MRRAPLFLVVLGLLLAALVISQLTSDPSSAARAVDLNTRPEPTPALTPSLPSKKPGNTPLLDTEVLQNERVALPPPPNPETPRGEVRVMDESEFFRRLSELGVEAPGGIFERLRGQRPELASLFVFVTDDDHQPVADALVAADPATRENLAYHVGSGGFSPNVRHAVSGADGVATLINLDPGELLLVAGHKDYLTQPFGTVGVKRGESTFVEITLERADTTLSGAVYDQDHQPLADVLVQASRYQEGGAAHKTTSMSAFDGSFAIAVQSGSTNRVSFAKLGYKNEALTSIPAGKQDVVAFLELIPTVHVRGFVTQGNSPKPVVTFAVDGQGFTHPGGQFEVERNAESAPQTLTFTAEGFKASTRTVDLSSGHDVDLGQVPLFGQSDLNGIVLLKAEAGLSPLAGATVAVTSAGGDTQSMATSADGAFSFGGLESGTVTLVASAVGAAPATRNVELDGVTYVEIQLEAGDYSVEGTITDAETKTPIEGASITLVELGGVATQTDAEGHYSIAGIPLTSFSVRAEADGYEPRTSPQLVGFEDPAEPLVWDAALEATGLRLALTLSGAPAPAGLEVFLWDSPATGLAAAQAAQANLATTRRIALTDAEGHVAFDVPPGAYFAQVQSHHLLPTRLTLTEGDSGWKPLGLPGLTTLSGTIRNSDGSPVANTSLWLHSGDQDYSTMMLFHTSSSGAYAIPHLAARPYALSIIKSSSDQSAQFVHEFNGSGAAAQVVNVTFPPLTASIHGRLTDAVGAPLVGVQVGVEYLDAPHRSILAGWVQTDSDGRYAVPHLEPGNHRVRSAWTEAPQAFSEVVTLAPGESKTLDLVTPIGPGLHITGSVIAADGGPLGPSFLFISDSQGRQNGNFFSVMAWAYTGTFDIKGLPPGSYTLTATAMGCKQKSVPVTAGSKGLVVSLERE